MFSRLVPRHAELVAKLAKLAKTHDGYFFGPVVRDFLLQEDTNDVDVWFKNLESVISFKEALNDIALIQENYKIRTDKRIQLRQTKYSTSTCFILL